jgi:hypothetical protein
MPEEAGLASLGLCSTHAGWSLSYVDTLADHLHEEDLHRSRIFTTLNNMDFKLCVPLSMRLQ